MKYREGDQVQIIDKASEYYRKKGSVLILMSSDDNGVWICFPPSKSTGRRFTKDQVKLTTSAIRGQEVEPNGCCISNMGGVSVRRVSNQT